MLFVLILISMNYFVCLLLKSSLNIFVVAVGSLIGVWLGIDWSLPLFAIMSLLLSAPLKLGCGMLWTPNLYLNVVKGILASGLVKYQQFEDGMKHTSYGANSWQPVLEWSGHQSQCVWCEHGRLDCGSYVMHSYYHKEAMVVFGVICQCLWVGM